MFKLSLRSLLLISIIIISTINSGSGGVIVVRGEQYIFQGSFNKDDGGRITIIKTLTGWSLTSDVAMKTPMQNKVDIIIDFVPAKGSNTSDEGFPLKFVSTGFPTPSNVTIYQVSVNDVSGVPSMDDAVAQATKTNATDRFTLQIEDKKNSFTAPLAYALQSTTGATTNNLTTTTSSPFTTTTSGNLTTTTSTSTTTSSSTTGVDEPVTTTTTTRATTGNSNILIPSTLLISIIVTIISILL
ncbi:hypothetical protein DFA_02278 [Cavenderia fasciculata]|uniref:Uncharacterized protein n=1 Tax=Cavenderia fasciculata TaxID=261658 RepID=F4PZ06_CACFS|nr:uncharacterized protein DFA_02278 [Cavenderia fasciculata]EGG19035.1 hypothetical protein DFA_02278 [Cavenderia fasciculata]|eukprot:XP_004366668.1 hypothetical protein DFA_02278 [Cavenderia fasciculata]